MPVGPFQRDLEQVLGGRPVVPGQQQRGPEQTGRGALDELLERHARLPHRHASYSTNAIPARQVERITEIVVEPAPSDIGRNVGSRRYGERMLDSFHPAVRAWFERRFPAGPTEPQAKGWAEIAAGRHTLIAAPTGSGKTLAAFLVCIDRIYRAHEAGHEPDDGPQVVYVSPLKALAVDIWQNLERPLAEIAEVAI